MIETTGTGAACGAPQDHMVLFNRKHSDHASPPLPFWRRLGACEDCRRDLGRAVTIALARATAAHRRAHSLRRSCALCAGGNGGGASNALHADACSSLDCPMCVTGSAVEPRLACNRRSLLTCMSHDDLLGICGRVVRGCGVARR